MVTVSDDDTVHSSENLSGSAVYRHQPVLLEEVCSFLALPKGGVYVDLTLGGGGHLHSIAGASAPQTHCVGVDRDQVAVENARLRFAALRNVTVVNASFGSLGAILGGLGITAVDSVLLDLGVSSAHFDRAERGFSFQEDGPLDMRMDATQTLTARDLLANSSHSEIARILREFGEERQAGRIAGAIVRERERWPLDSTAGLRRIVESAISPAHRVKTLARVFQGIRIAVNDELAELARVLPQVVVALAPGGKVGVISYHSLEDRIVKDFFRSQSDPCNCPPKAPMCVCGRQATVRILTRKPVTPSANEIASNSRARSAKLRVAERLNTPALAEVSV